MGAVPKALCVALEMRLGARVLVGVWQPLGPEAIGLTISDVVEDNASILVQMKGIWFILDSYFQI